MQSAEIAGRPLTGAEGADEASPILKQGDTVGGRFVIDERLRSDCLGSVYRAVDEKSGKRIAIVLLDAAVAQDRETTEALRSSVKAATKLAHKNLVSVFGMGKEGQRRYVAREFVDGQTLAELLDKKASAGKRFTLKGAYNLVAHICNALDAAREVMPHGILRPSSVLINRTGRVKVADFGLERLRPALLARRAALSPWDRACLQSEDGDDRFALGAILFGLLAGRPPVDGERQLPAEVVALLPAGVDEVIGGLLQLDAPGRLADPAAVKAALQAVLVDGRGPDASVEQGAAIHAGASLEVLAPSRSDVIEGPTPTPAAPAVAAVPRASTGFVIPELGGPTAMEDDGSTQRWLVERNGTDYGPYSRQQVIDQLFKEEITSESVIYDVETDRRATLGEFSVFDQVLVDWIHEKAAREKRRAEESAAAAARRRNRILGGFVALLLLGVGGGAGGWFWYQSTLPEPVPARLARLVTGFEASLPAISLPEELPETEAEIRERRQKRASQRALAKARQDAAQAAKEARLAASSEVAMGAGGDARFDRAAFNQVIAGRQARITSCLEAEVRRDPGLKAVKVKITAVPQGDLIDVQLEGGTPRGHACVRDALRGAKVPAFDGTNVKVSLPYNIQ